MIRTVSAETLDELPHDDPAAVRSRRDLRRVNRVMGASGILLGALHRVLPAAPERPLRLVEIGCGDGHLMLDVAQALGDAWRGTSLLLLDRQPIVSRETLAGYQALGWHAGTHTGDVLDWATAGDDSPRADAIVANLFLHHFEGEALSRLLAGCARRADALVAAEPRRSAFALLASRLVGFIGANAVTREDAVLSVQAGFRGDELEHAWPAAGWRCDEYDAGLFTHCFCAQRTGAPR